MAKKKNNKKQELGIYYTPEVVVEFIFDILNVLKNKDARKNRRWQFKKPKPHYPSVIDPACGEGIFLKKAVESEFTGYHPKYKVPYIFGVDIDKTVVARWEEISVLGLFKGNKELMQTHFYHQNGLEDLPKRTLLYKKGGLREYDTVVGNPPYGGTGLRGNKISGELEKTLVSYEIWRYAFGEKKRGQVEMFTPGEVEEVIRGKIKSKIQKYPIEILFIERFLQLCKPDGWIAIIIPDGILANSTYDYVRRFIAERAKILAVVSLPRETFKQVGTTAKTSILFLQKAKNQLLTNPRDWDYPAFLASVNKIEKELFDIIAKGYQDFVGKGVLTND